MQCKEFRACSKHSFNTSLLPGKPFGKSYLYPHLTVNKLCKALRDKVKLLKDSQILKKEEILILISGYKAWASNTMIKAVTLSLMLFPSLLCIMHLRT